MVIKMEKFPSEFENLLKQAKDFIMSAPSAEQVIAVQTFKGNIVCFGKHDVISGNTADEEAFVKILSENEDTMIQYAICMWKDFSLDVPSHYFQNLLVSLNSFNRETKILLTGGECFIAKSLKFMLDKL